MDDMTGWNPAEPTALTTPSHAAFLVRDGETVWVFAYPQVRMVVETYPPVPVTEPTERRGVIRERYVGARADVGAVFVRQVASLLDNGWTHHRANVHRVWAGEPWDTMAAFDQPPTF